MQWSIQQIARLSGTTSRTLRHYDDIGLLPPTSIGANGYRYYARGDAWWRGLGTDGQAAFRAEAAAIEAWLRDARASGTPVTDPAVQGLIARHYAWVRAGWGETPLGADAYLGLADMYVGDPRFAKHYGGPDGAEYVARAMRVYAASALA